MDSFTALDRARAEVERRLDAVGPDQWSLPTPCTDWTVHDVVRHLVVGNKMATLLVTGASRDDTIAQMKEWHRADGTLAPDALVAAFATTADEQAAALRRPGRCPRSGGSCHRYGSAAAGRRGCRRPGGAR